MRALAHPVRVAIMCRLAQQKQCSEGLLSLGFPISEQVLATHLLALERAGLINGITKINKSYYCINWDAFWEFSDDFNLVFNNFERRANELHCDLSTPTRKRI